jgi:hypothetical protein
MITPDQALAENLPFIEWEDDSGATQRLYADVLLSEETTLAASVSEHPIEAGADITDHYRPENETVDLVLIFTDSGTRGDLSPNAVGSERLVPLVYPAARQQTDFQKAFDTFSPGALVRMGLNTLNPPTPLPTSVKAFAFDAQPSRGAEAFDTIQQIRLGAKICKVSTTIIDFIDMVLTSAKILRDDTTDQTKVSVSFQRVRFVQTDVAIALPVEPRAQKATKAGAQGTHPEEAEVDKRSFAKKLLNKGGLAK